MNGQRLSVGGVEDNSQLFQLYFLQSQQLHEKKELRSETKELKNLNLEKSFAN
jgi:hypothetical protein